MVNPIKRAIAEKPAGVPWTQYARKATVAAFTGALALLGSLVTSMASASDGGGSITGPEAIQAAIVTITTVGGALGVFLASNKGASGT